MACIKIQMRPTDGAGPLTKQTAMIPLPLLAMKRTHEPEGEISEVKVTVKLENWEKRFDLHTVGGGLLVVINPKLRLSMTAEVHGSGLEDKNIEWHIAQVLQNVMEKSDLTPPVQDSVWRDWEGEKEWFFHREHGKQEERIIRVVEGFVRADMAKAVEAATRLSNVTWNVGQTVHEATRAYNAFEWDEEFADEWDPEFEGGGLFPVTDGIYNNMTWTTVLTGTATPKISKPRKYNFPIMSRVRTSTPAQ